MKKYFKLSLILWIVCAAAILVTGLYLGKDIIFAVGGISLIINILVWVGAKEKDLLPT